MDFRLPRILLAAASAILFLGGLMHAAAYAGTAVPGLAKANLPAFLATELKVLWLGDSTTLIGVAALAAIMAAKPAWTTRPVTMMLAIIPAATAALIYIFLGAFYAGHMLMAAAAIIFLAGFLTPDRPLAK